MKRLGLAITPQQIFDHRIEEIARAEKDAGLDILALVEKNLVPRRRFEHVRSWPRVIAYMPRWASKHR